MATKGPATLQTDNNGMIRCYNMFPSYFTNIEEMTAYLDTLKEMGINTVWLNPIQLAGDNSMGKADSTTGISQRVTRSMYAMDNPLIIDPRFSMVKRDQNGDILLSSSQIHILMGEQKLLEPVFSTLGIEFCPAAISVLLKSMQNSRRDIACINEKISTIKDLETEVKKTERLVESEKRRATLTTQKSKDDKKDSKSGFFAKFCQNEQLAVAMKRKLGELKITGALDSLNLETIIKEHVDFAEFIKATLSGYAKECEQEKATSEAHLKKLFSIQEMIIHVLDKRALQQFTQKARSLGITPIFDLVLNHVAKDAPVQAEHQDWFGTDGTYLDAIAFKYSELLQFVHMTDTEIDALIAKDSALLAPIRKRAIDRDLTEDDKALIQKSKKLTPVEKEQLTLQVIFNLVRLTDRQCDEIIETLNVKPEKAKASTTEQKPAVVPSAGAFSPALIERIKGQRLTAEDISFIRGSKLSKENQEKLINKSYYALTQQEREEILMKIPEIMQNFWSKFIETYVDYGFSGARVDCVRKVPQEVRQHAYDLLKSKVQERDGKEAKVVILEEALFSDLSAKQFADVVKGAGATHTTGSIFNNQRLWHGGLSYDHNEEDYHKKSMVSDGVINFTGNHDHYSCAMTVCREIAFERLQQNAALYAEYQSAIPNSEAMKDIRKTIFCHHYIQEVIRELQNPKQNWDQCMRFGRRYRDKLLTNMFLGSGGYYMLSGDEFASLAQPTVFVRENGQPLYPTRDLLMLSDKDHPLFVVAHNTLRAVAETRARKGDSPIKRTQLQEADWEILLSGYKQQVRNELNAEVQTTQSDFLTEFHRQYALALLKTATSLPLKKEAGIALAQAKEELQIQLAKKGRKQQSTPFKETEKLSTEALLAQQEQDKQAREAAEFDAYFAKMKSGIQKVFPNMQTREFEYVGKPSSAKNGWARPEFLQKFANVDFFKEVNELMSKLPASQTGYWSEIFMLSEDVIVIARKNGAGFDSESDLVIINLNPDKPYNVNHNDIHKMAMWLQERKFGRGAYDTMKDNPEFKKAYGAFMGNAEFKQLPAKLYFAGLLTVDQDVIDHKVMIDGIERGFDIVVKPKPLPQIPLELPPPPVFIPEFDIPKSFTPMASGTPKLSLKQSIQGTGQQSSLALSSSSLPFSALSLDDTKKTQEQTFKGHTLGT
jgi:hypothetical protein